MTSYLSSALACVFFVVYIVGLQRAFAQSDSLASQWAEFLEEDSELIELLQEWQNRPVYLNEADRDALLRLPYMTPALVDTILNWRKTRGRIKSKRALRPLLGEHKYEMVRTFITAARPPERRRGYYAHKNYVNAETYREVKRKEYRGDFLYDYNKLFYQPNEQIELGFVTQKDAGERHYLDYYNGYASYRNTFGKVIVGQFYLQTGEGLAFYNPFGSQKSAMVLLPLHSVRQGGFAYLSSAENTGFFGVYAEGAILPGSSLSLFYSNRNLDAIFADDGQTITGFDYDGYHRSQSEEAKKDKIRERVVGGILRIEPYQRVQLSVAYARYHYDPSVSFEKSVVSDAAWRRQRFHFNGHRLNQLSFSYSMEWKRLFVSGEALTSDRGSPAYAQTAMFDLDTFAAGVKAWYATRNLQSPGGRLFDDRSPFPGAEKGIYAAAAVRPTEGLNIKGYKLLKLDLWRSYFNPMPVARDEWLVQTDYKWAESRITLRVRRKEREDYSNTIGDRYVRNEPSQIILRLQLDHRADRRWRFRTRWQATRLTHHNESGRYLFEDVRYRMNKQTTIDTRMTFFLTDSYESRLYEYESDLPASFANYALYGRGYKWYVRIRWRFREWFSIWMKYRYFRITDIMPAVQGFEPEGRFRRELRLQIKIDF